MVNLTRLKAQSKYSALVIVENVPLEMILELWRTNERPFQRLVNLDLKEFDWNITSEE